MDDFIIQLIVSALSSTVLCAVLFWLLRTWISDRLKNAIKHEYDSKLESHKALLQAQTAVETERLRSQLSMQATEHAVRFQRLHERRAEVIGQLYSLLTEAYWKASTFASPIEFAGDIPKKEMYSEAHSSLMEFFKYFEKNRIYLPTVELCESIDRLVVGIRRHITSFSLHLHKDDESMSSAAVEKKYEVWMNAWEYMEKEVPFARTKLENEFRSILGG